MDNSVADGLRRRGIDVTTTPEVELISASDDEQLAFAIAEQRVIFTQDADFLRFDRTGVSHSEIAFCRKNTRSIGDIMSGLILIWECLNPKEMCDRVEFI